MDFLVVGLGNPGSEYDLTRHNIGFIVIDELCRRWRFPEYSVKWNAEYCSGMHRSSKIHFVKPLTFMNRSGQAVSSFHKFYKMNPEQLLVVHDDLDMSPGRIKLVKGGGAGGHNGIKSIVQCLGVSDFYRLKIGIGRPGQGEVHSGFPVEKYVLSKFNFSELEIIESRIESLADGVESFIVDGAAKAMNILNSLK